MPSPFPGMDPYLEDPSGWSGVHLGLLYAIHAQLNRVLPEGFVAELDQYVWAVEKPSNNLRAIGRPDVFVPTRPRSTQSRPEPDAIGTILAPPTVRTRLPKQETHSQRYVRITTDHGARVVTVLEVLSPANKNAGEGRETYLRKRHEYVAARTNVVEVDLLRSGHRLPMGEPEPPLADYYLFVSPANRLPNADVWAFTVREPLPVFPVPLTAKLPPVPLDLRECLDRLYDEGRYAEKIDYTQPPVPALRPHDAEWAAELLKKPSRKRK